MYKERIDVPADVLNALVSAAETYPDRVKTEFPKAVRQTLDRTLNRLRVEPPAPTYPLRWKSERQRKAYFATNGFGKGVPYRRTGALVRGWSGRVEPSPDGARLVIENPARYTEFVQGESQQPFHADTGWAPADDVIIEESIALENTLIDVFFSVMEETTNG